MKKKKKLCENIKNFADSLLNNTKYASNVKAASNTTRRENEREMHETLLPQLLLYRV